jgi:hypothetical protein
MVIFVKYWQKQFVTECISIDSIDERQHWQIKGNQNEAGRFVSALITLYPLLFFPFVFLITQRVGVPNLMDRYILVFTTLLVKSLVLKCVLSFNKPVMLALFLQLCDLYENDSIFDKFECCLSGDGTRAATGSYRCV